MPYTPRVLAALLCLVFLAGCGDAPAKPADHRPAPVGNFTAALDGLKVAPERPMANYKRERFPHWNKAGSNCDVRDTVLERDGKNTKKTGCNITDGEWFSVYDGLTLTDPLKVDVDHMVPLANAWRSGADIWDDSKRSEFANDLDRPQLRAVSIASNRSKGDRDPSLWQPPLKEFWCTYAQEWIAVKSHWKLTVTSGEKRALTDMLATCG